MGWIFDALRSLGISVHHCVNVLHPGCGAKGREADGARILVVWVAECRPYLGCTVLTLRVAD